MSYCSQVAVCMLKENFLELKKVFQQAEMSGEIDKYGAELLKHVEIRYIENDEDYIIFEFPYIKWYQEFKEIRCFMNYISDLCDAEIPVKFIRIGEDYEDIEVIEYYGNGECDHIEVSRDISVY